MKPSDYIECIYEKNGIIKEVEDAWAPFYLNKIFIQNPKNAEVMNRIIEYCVYLTPTQYFYLLYILIPKQYGVRYSYPAKKTEADEEDKLIAKIRYILGWSVREFELNRKQLEATILKDKDYWCSELGVSYDKPKRTRKTV